jgi:hypothetical protein
MFNQNNITVLDEITESGKIACVKISSPDDYTLLESDRASSSFKILSANIRSIRSNIDLLLVFISRFSTLLDIIVLTECWTNENYTPPPINNYVIYQTKKYLNQNDGVVVYIRDTYVAKVYEPLCNDGNCIVAELLDICIICSYRPPSFKNPTNYLNSLYSIISDCGSVGNLVLTGDINLDILSQDKGGYVDSYLNLMAVFGLRPAITLPTRQNTCLDHFMVRTTQWVQSFVFDELTDYLPTLIQLNPKINSGSRSLKPLITKVNTKKVMLQLSQVDWTDFYNITNVNELAMILTSEIEIAVRNSSESFKLPKRKLPLKPWITPSVVRAIRKRDRMHKALKKEFECDTHLKETYINYRNTLKKVIKSLKCNFYNKLLEINKGNVKKTWSIIHEICNKRNTKTAPVDLLHIDDSPPTESLDKVNNFFTSVGSNLANKILDLLNTNEQELANRAKSPIGPLHSMSLYLTDPLEVASIINGLKNNTSPGVDEVSANILKECRYILSEPVAHLVNCSFESGIFPKLFKKAVVCPVYKSGNKSLPTNYRPISLLSSISKLIEKIANKRLMTYLESHKFLSDTQYGFRSNRSSDDAVLRLVNAITNYVDRNKKCIGVFLDLQKAFDTVSIPILLTRLDNIGVRGNALMWFQDYLSDRSQCVRVDNHYSCFNSITYGIPQGSTLGPTLFLAYINALGELKVPGASIQMFADDTVVLFHEDSWENVFKLAETGLCTITAWLEDSLLSLNADKTKFLCFSKTAAGFPGDMKLQLHSFPCNRNGYLSFDSCACSELEGTSSVRYLGVMVDDKLKWADQISAVSKRLRKLIYVFRDLRIISDSKLLIQIYKALAECVLTYCICSWGGGAKSHMIEVERAQRAVLKVLLYLPYTHPTRLVYETADVLTVRKLFIQQCIRRYHKNAPTLDDNKRRVRYPVPKVLSRFAFRQFSSLAPRLYNKFNKIIVTRNLSAYQIKSKIRDWLHNCSYEEVESLLDD